MTTANPIRDQLTHITVDYDQQGRLILDLQGKKYEVTLESNDGQGNTNPLALQRGATTDKIKTLIAGLFKAHVIHDQETSDVQRMNHQGLRYTNGTLKSHDFFIWDKQAQDANRNAASKELVDALAPHLGGTYVDELVKAQTIWDKLENLATHPAESLNVNTAPASNPAFSTSSGTFSSTSSQEQVRDPMRRINPRPSIEPATEPAAPVSPTSPNINLFDEADDEIVADLTIDNVPSSKPISPLFSPLLSPFPSPVVSPRMPQREKIVHFAPPSLRSRHPTMSRLHDSLHRRIPKNGKNGHSAMQRVKDSFYRKYTPPKKRKLTPNQFQGVSTTGTN